MMSYKSRTSGVVLVALGVLHLGEAVPVSSISSIGCTCTSSCGQSWHKTGDEWCYVGKQCKYAGWDFCRNDAQKLHSSGSIEKKKSAEERSGTSGKDQGILHFAFSNEEHSLWQRLKEKLKATEQQKVVEETELQAVEKKLENSQRYGEEEEQKLVVVKKHAGALQSELTETKAQLTDSDLKVTSLKQQLSSALKKEGIAEAKADEEQHEVEKAKQMAAAIAKTAAANDARKQADTDKKLSEAQHEVADAQAHQKETQAQVVALTSAHHQDELKLSDATLKLSAADKKLTNAENKARNAFLKFKGTEKTLNTLKDVAGETSKKLKASVLEASRLKDVEKKYVDSQKALAISEKDNQKAYAELRPFREAVRRAVLA